LIQNPPKVPPLRRPWRMKTVESADRMALDSASR
jgi:hypothetical protein